MIVGVCMVRDEEDIIGPLMAHMLNEGCDWLLIADNLSTDGTRYQLDLAADTAPVIVINDDEPGYYQAEKMTNLARKAADMGAEWVIPFDADELWYCPDGDRISDVLYATTADIVCAAAYDHIATPKDGYDPNPFLRITHRRTYRQRLPKVCFRAHPDAQLHMGNHDVDRPGERAELLELRHFQYRSLDHLRQKVRQGAAAYDAAPDLHAMYGTHWKSLAALPDEALAEEWAGMCAEPDLIYDPAPWRD